MKKDKAKILFSCFFFALDTPSMGSWNALATSLGGVVCSWLAVVDVFHARSACRGWRAFVPAWTVIHSGDQLRICQPNAVQHIVFNAYGWKLNAETWSRIADCVHLRSLDCSTWWDWVGSDNEVELVLASLALRDKKIETLIIGVPRNIGGSNCLSESKAALLRNLRYVRHLHFCPAAPPSVLELLACFSRVTSVTLRSSCMGPISLPSQLGCYRSLSLEVIYDDSFLPSLHGCRLEEISLEEYGNSAALVQFLHANPQLVRVRLSMDCTATDELITQIKEMSATRFALVWCHAYDVTSLRDARNVDFLVLGYPRDFDDFDMRVITSLTNLECFGLEVARWSRRFSLDPLRHLPKLRTFAMCALDIEPPLCLAWTHACASLREVSVLDSDDVWCAEAAPESLPPLMQSATKCGPHMKHFYFPDVMKQHASQK